MDDPANEALSSTRDTFAKINAEITPGFIRSPPVCIRGGVYGLVQEVGALSVDLVCSLNSGIGNDKHN